MRRMQSGLIQKGGNYKFSVTLPDETLHVHWLILLIKTELKASGNLRKENLTFLTNARRNTCVLN